MDDKQLTAMRGSKIDFVFEFHHLTSAFSVFNNALMPLMLTQGKPNTSVT
jgi:lipoprotein-releasing system ATP-binding protein